MNFISRREMREAKGKFSFKREPPLESPKRRRGVSISPLHSFNDQREGRSPSFWIILPLFLTARIAVLAAG